jgi:hypothetical protein
MGAQGAEGVVFLAVAAVAAVIGPERLRRLLPRRLLPRPGGVPRADPATALPAGRRIDLIAGDVRRLGRRFETVPPGLSFARFEALRQAYDTVLAEACGALEIEHLLGVLPPGPDLDGERRRVEQALDRAGLRLYDDR